MRMNNKKIIFIVFLWVIALIVIILAFLLVKNTENNQREIITSSDFRIWILEDSKYDFNIFLDKFKKDTNNTHLSISVETFSNYEEYSKILASAIIQWKAPDLYMLNNNEKSIFLENAIWIDPNVISPNELRTYFYPFFWDDLIYSFGEGEERTEFIIWVPFWYETLWLYFNMQRVNDVKKLRSFPEIKSLIYDFNKKRPDLVALWIWKWTTVVNSEHIITQFLMAENIYNIHNIGSIAIRNTFSEYFAYNSWKNWYTKINDLLLKQWKTNVDAFIDWDIAMIFGFPRLLSYIDEKWFPKRLLRVVNFPDFINESSKLVNYNYFVLNKNSENKQIATELLKYIFSEQWQKAYIDVFRHYLPARISLYSSIKDRLIHDDFHIKQKHFFNPEANYSSFDKWLKTEFDASIITILDSEEWYLQRVNNFLDTLKCRTNKIIKLENLSKDCG